MNYEPNTITWTIGALVLHDCDAKRADMLLRVVKYLPNGKVRAEYVEEKWHRSQFYRRRRKDGDSGWFDLCDLHDPARFNVEVPR